MEEHSKKLLAAEIDNFFFLIRIRSFLSMFRDGKGILQLQIYFQTAIKVLKDRLKQ